MSDALAALGRSLQQVGGSIQNLGSTVYRVDAKRKFEDESIAIATEIEDFKQALWTDPDAGTPGSRDGYVKKWDEFKKGIEQRMQKVDNPLARQELEQYWAQTSLQQESAVEQLQFKKWAADTVAATGKRITTRIETGAFGVQDQLDLAAEDLRYLKDNNLISASEYETMMAESSQQIILKDLRTNAEATYNEKGLAAAQQYIAKASETYDAGGGKYTAGDAVKKMALADLQLFHETIQYEEDERMQTAFANFYLLNEGQKAEGPMLTATLIQDSRLDTPRKQYWLSQLDGMNRIQGGSASAESKAIEVENYLTEIAYALMAGRGEIAGQAKITVAGADGKPVYYPVTREGYEALKAEYRGILYSRAGAAARFGGLEKDMGSMDAGALKDAFDIIEKGLKVGAQRLEAQAYLRLVYKDNPNMSPQDIAALATREVAQKKYTTQLTSRFEWGQKLMADSDDRLVFDLWDNQFAYHVGADAGNPAAPIHWATRDALQSYEAGFMKEVGASTGLFDPTKGTPDNVRSFWAPAPGKKGGSEYVVQVVGTNGDIQEYRGVPMVDQADKRQQATMLRTTVSGPTGSKTETLELYDPATKQWVKVGAGEKKSNGWSLPRAEQQARDDQAKRLAQLQAQLGQARSELNRVESQNRTGRNQVNTNAPAVKRAQAEVDRILAEIQALQGASTSGTGAGTSSTAGKPSEAR